MTRSTVKHYFSTLFVFVVLGAIWLGLIAQPFYQARIGFYPAGAFGDETHGREGSASSPI